MREMGLFSQKRWLWGELTTTFNHRMGSIRKDRVIPFLEGHAERTGNNNHKVQQKKVMVEHREKKPSQ